MDSHVPRCNGLFFVLADGPYFFFNVNFRTEVTILVIFGISRAVGPHYFMGSLLSGSKVGRTELFSRNKRRKLHFFPAVQIYVDARWVGSLSLHRVVSAWSVGKLVRYCKLFLLHYTLLLI